LAKLKLPREGGIDFAPALDSGPGLGGWASSAQKSCSITNGNLLSRVLPESAGSGGPGAL
jgi:hypothetical protein